MTSGTTGPIAPGTLLAGRYRLEDLLTESAGARFWRATDTVLARNVAVHALPSTDGRAATMMEAARLSATVNDSHLLRVLDADDADGVCWVVHEWGEGISLDLMLERGPLAPARAAWLAREVAVAVAAGHAQGVAHGRLNPEAVLVTHGGSVKLIGYVVDAVLHESASEHPVYGDLDAYESDVVDVAGVLYAALTGKWPGASPSAVAPAPLEGQRPLRPRQVRAGVPRALDAICERVLHPEGSRHDAALTTAHEVAAALSEVTGEGTPGAPGGLGPGALHDEPTSVISRAALGQEARRRDPDHEESSGTVRAHDEQTVHAPLPTEADAAGPGPAPGPGPGPGPATGDLEPTQAALAAGPAMEQTALHREPLEGPDSLGPLRAPDPVPPPPPFEDVPERPLFATTERRVPGASRATGVLPSGAAPGAGDPPQGRAADTGAGAVPPADYWPFDSDEGPAPTPDAHAGRGWLRTAIIVGLVLATVVAMVVAFSVGRNAGMPGLGGDAQPSDELTQSGPPAGQEIEIEDLSDFDPQGSPPFDENPDQVPNAVDGDPETVWTTATYFNRADLGGLKDGVGLMLDLGSEQQVGELAVQLATSPTDLEVYAASEGATSAPTGIEEMELVGSQDGAGESVEVALDPAPTTRFLVLWLTELPPTEGGFRGEVAELSVRS